MPGDRLDPEITLLLALVDQAYDHKAWHGTNLRGSVSGISAELAAWRPQPGRHNIAEQVLHAAYWKYAARRLIRGDKRGSFLFKGSNWFDIDEPISEGVWRGFVQLLDAEHLAFREALAEMPAKRLDETSAKKKYTFRAILLGVPSHDLYHAGQIQLIKRLYQSTQS